MHQIYKYVFVLVFLGSSSLFAGDKDREFDTLRMPFLQSVKQAAPSAAERAKGASELLESSLSQGLPKFSYSFGGSPPETWSFEDLVRGPSNLILPPMPSVSSTGEGLPLSTSFPLATEDTTVSPIATTGPKTVSCDEQMAGGASSAEAVVTAPAIGTTENILLTFDPSVLLRDLFAPGAAVSAPKIAATADTPLVLEEKRVPSEASSTEDVPVSASAAELPSIQEVDTMEEWVKDVPAIYVDLFWATGVDRDPRLFPSDARVLIGGKEIYASSFVPKMRDFLMRMPQKLIVTMVCDELTYQSNKADLQGLSSEFKDRFSIRLIGDILGPLKTVHPAYERTLDVLLRNAEWGNPAIASDAFRLLLRSVHVDAAAGAELVYSDVDLFCAHNPPLTLPTPDETAFEQSSRQRVNENAEEKRHVYAENICNPKRVGHKRRVSDFIKFIKMPGDEKKDTRVLDHFKVLLDGPAPTIITHCPTLLVYFQRYAAEGPEARRGIFEDYLRYVQARPFNIKDDIINTTGPDLVQSQVVEDLFPGLEYAEEYAACWFDVRSAIPAPYVFTLMPNVQLYTLVEMFVERTLRMSSDVLSFKSDQSRDPISVMKETNVLAVRHSFTTPEGFFAKFRDFERDGYGMRTNAIHSELHGKYKSHRAMFSDLGWLKRFGEDHPFCQNLKTYLMEFFDVRRNSDVQKLLRIYHEYDLSHREIKAYTSEEWAEMIWIQMQNFSYSPRDLLDVFQTVSASFGLSPLTASDIQAIIETS